MTDDIRKFPAVYKQISNIKENDVRVSILGTIIDRQEGLIIIDDGSGRIRASFQDTSFGLQQVVRVFGRVIPTPDGCELQGEVIQDMSKLDLSLFKKVQQLEA